MNLTDKKRANLIICPKCGREYLPAEIYIPNSFFGRPIDIDRTDSGKIEDYDGPLMNLNEEYICDSCGTTFEVEAFLKFKTKEKIEKKFESIYSTPLYIQKLSLFEGD